MEISKQLQDFVGKKVAVVWTTEVGNRRGFHTQISVSGTLEKHPDAEDYRVLVNQASYAYFKSPEVYLIVSDKMIGMKGAWQTREGEKAVIYISEK